MKVMKYNPVYDLVLTADSKGLIDYWSPETLNFPTDRYVEGSRLLVMVD